MLSWLGQHLHLPVSQWQWPALSQVYIVLSLEAILGDTLCIWVGVQTQLGHSVWDVQTCAQTPQFAEQSWGKGKKGVSLKLGAPICTLVLGTLYMEHTCYDGMKFEVRLSINLP